MEILDQLKIKNKSNLKIKIEYKGDKKNINNKVMNQIKINNNNLKIFKIKLNNSNKNFKMNNNKHLINQLLYLLNQILKQYKYLNNLRINNNSRNKIKYLVILN